MRPIQPGDTVEFTPSQGSRRHFGELGEVVEIDPDCGQVKVRFGNTEELWLAARHLVLVLSEREMRDEKRELRRRHFALKRLQAEG